MSENKNYKYWKDVWDSTENPTPMQFDDKKAYADFLNKIAKPNVSLSIESVDEIHPFKLSSKIFQLRYWASAIAALFIGVVAFSFFSNDAMVHLNAGDVATEYTLPDDSKVILYPNSTLSYDKSTFNISRQTILNGKALFDVTKNQNDFTITQGDVKVTVLGTTFIVSPKEVKVLEGKVSVVTPVEKTMVTTRQKVDLKDDKLTIEPANFTDEVLSTPSMSYENEPLGKVLSDIEVKFGVVISNPQNIDLTKCLITSTNMSKSSFDECVKVLYSITGLKLSSSDKEHFSVMALSCN